MSIQVGTITLDGLFTDWLATDALMTSENTVTGYQVYGAFLNDATLGNTYVIGIDATAATEQVIAAGTVIYLNTDQNNTTGYELSFGNVGAEYEVQFVLDTTGALQPYLYSVTSTGVTTQLNGGLPLDSGFSSDGESVELAIPQSLLTPAGGAAPTSINFATLINNAVGLPTSFSSSPEYIITDTAVPPTTIGNTITLDGTFSDWPAADIVTNPANVAAGYQIYGAFLDDATLGNTYVIGIDAAAATDPVIGPSDTIYLNTDQNAATGYDLSFANIGAEYEVQFAYGSNAALEPFLYSVTAAGVTTLLNGGAPLDYGFSSNGETLEVAIPQSLLTPAGGTAPTSINFVALNGSQGLPSDLANNPEYTITDPATLAARAPTHKVAIVYSDTTAALYFSQTAYSDLFMAAQNQARMAGVSYDIIDESQLTNINNLIGYDAIIFPSMADVNTAQLPAIMSTLTSAVYNYHIGIITAGDFLTNDQTGAPLPGNAYSNMETLLGLARVSGGNSGAISVTANDVTNPIMKSYTAGQVIQTYPSEGYADYQAVGGTAMDVLVNQTVTDPTLTGGTETIPGVIQTTTGGTNVEFASQDLLGDSNLLSNAIQAVALGTQPGVTLHLSRDAGVVAVRMDMDQSQFPSDVTPTVNGVQQPASAGIYGTLIPILQQWNTQYDFVGSYFLNVGDNPSPLNGTDPSTTNWTASLPYYQDLLAMGSEIGTHSYTHLINPPTETFTAVTSGDTPAGSTTITLTGAPPSFAGVTVGMFVTASNGALGTNTPLPGAAGEGGSIANSQVTVVSGDTITISYVPGGYGTANDGTTGDIPAGTTLTFSIPAENTNFLQTATTTNPVLSATGNPFTYAYEFQQSAALESQQLGIPIEGAAIPGANETFATDQNILPYFQSVAPTATTPGYTGFLTGGWTGVGSGYPSAIGYMSPSATDEGSLYIAPNMTFDFTEIQYEGKTVAQAEADWAAQFNALTANAAGTPVVVLPVHDYGVAAWNTTTDTGTGSPYTTAMYTQFIAQAYADNYEFLTLEELAARDEAQQKAAINYTTVGNTITATVTPDPTAPDVGGMALDVINGGTDVIQNVTNWYAYNAQELFLPTNGGTFTINLGTTQDAVTHIESLPMRGDLLSVTGNGLNLSFAMAGTGDVVVDLANTDTPIVTGATVVSDVGNQLTLSLTNAGTNNVSITLAAPPMISGTVAGQATTDLATIAPFSKVTIADSNANQTETVTVTLSAPANGTLSNLGGGTYTAPTGVYTDTGTAAVVTAALDALVFTPTVNQVAPGQTVTTGFTITDTDTALATATDSTTTVVATDTAVPPTITGTVTGQLTSDRQTITPFSKVTIADLNLGQTETVTVTLSAAANGALSDLIGGSYDATTGVYTDSGTAAVVTSALDALVFTPTINQAQVLPGQNVTTIFTIADTDTALATATDSTTTVVATDVGAPTLTGPLTATVNQGAATPIAGLSLAEIANVAGETFTVTLGDTNGLLSATGTGVTGSGTTSLTIAGSLATVNSDLATLSDTDAATPSDTITLNAVDSFGVAAAPQSIAVTVTPGQTFTLTTGKDTVAGGAANNTIIAKTATLTAGDSINGGTATNTLELQGGGTFNLAAPATLTNIAVITAQEGQGTTAQTVTLRAGLNATVNVASDTTATDTSPTITITGAANSDVINLGTGNDTVTLGAGETVNSGGGNNTFKVASATLGNVTINGSAKGANTLSVTGGGTATMGAGITGITTVQLASATTFTANATAGLTIVGSAGADKITAGGAGQVLTGGAGANTLTGSSAGNDIFRDTAADLNGDTIANLLASDVIDITNLAPATAVISKSTVSAASTVLTLTSGTTSSKITLSGSYQGSFALAADGTGGTDLTFVPASVSTVTLPTTPATITTGPVSTTIVATAATLLPADSITGGTGTGVSNTLQLSGGGAFNLAALAKLTNINVVAAQEGQGTTAQTVTLRAGLNATVNVASAAGGGITIIGATNSDVINLGAGNDTVTLGSGETVNGGAGTDVYNVTKTTIGNTTIKGGSGSNTLVVTGGGNATMGAGITGINAVQLATTTNFTANTTAGLQISGSSTGGDTITLGAPTQSVIAGGPNETIKATAANAGAAISGLGANSTLDITTGGTIALNATTDVSTVKLSTASNLTLNQMQFITATGSSGADTIQAGATNQTLTGGAGADTLIGFSGGLDTFKDTAANLNGDTISGFVTSDTIDLTNLAYAATDKVTTATSGTNTKVTVTAGTTKSTFTLAGSWSSSGFLLKSDGAAGTFLTHT
jgi:serralysin